MTPQPSIAFDQGTLLLSGFTAEGVAKIFPKIGWVFDSRVGKYRTDAIHYAEVDRALAFVAGRVDNDVERWQKVAWSKNNLPTLRTQQQQAVEAFVAANHRGVVVMPTGTGKTVVALAIARAAGRVLLIRGSHPRLDVSMAAPYPRMSWLRRWCHW